MDTPESSITGDTGVALVSFIVGDQLKWIFRSQPSADVGIDAHVEVVQDGQATGRLLALQIKSGKSWFRESTSDGFVFRPEARHVEYWLGHALPVVVVLANADERIAYWQVVTEETVTCTGARWKMTVPATNILSAAAAAALMGASEGDAYTLKLRQMQFARPWMEHLAAGGRLNIDFDEWINKTSGRASLLLMALDAHEEVVAVHEWPLIFLPFADYAVELPRMFPWANLTMDAEDDEDDWASYEEECGIWDKEEQKLVYTLTYDEWRADQGNPGLGPVWDNGEVAHWCLDLELSDLGRAFLTLDEFLSNEVLHALFGR